MKNIKISLWLLAAAVLTLGAASCSGNAHKKAQEETETSDYHADNDIAMTLRSIIDAVNVGQKLDSAEYNFRGTLTDGTGRPLYTDIQGTPGAWEVKVTTPEASPSATST